MIHFKEDRSFSESTLLILICLVLPIFKVGGLKVSFHLDHHPLFVRHSQANISLVSPISGALVHARSHHDLEATTTNPIHSYQLT
jgi:hypothetical protein